MIEIPLGRVRPKSNFRVMHKVTKPVYICVQGCIRVLLRLERQWYLRLLHKQWYLRYTEGHFLDQRYHRLTFTSGNSHIITKSYFSKINDISITRKIVFGRTLPKGISIMCNFGPYVGRQNFGKMWKSWEKHRKWRNCRRIERNLVA